MSKKNKRKKSKKGKVPTSKRCTAAETALTWYNRAKSVTRRQDYQKYIQELDGDIQALGERYARALDTARVYVMSPQVLQNIRQTVRSTVPSIKRWDDYLTTSDVRLVIQDVEIIDGEIIPYSDDTLLVQPAVMEKLIHDKKRKLRGKYKQHYVCMRDTARCVPIPDPSTWPFESMWISFGDGLLLTKEETFNRYLWEDAKELLEDEALPARIASYFLYQDNDHVHIVEGLDVSTSDPINGLFMVSVYTTSVPNSGHFWCRPGDDSPWVIRALMKLLCTSSAYEKREPTYWDKQAHAKSSVQKDLPAPYYVLRMQQKSINTLVQAEVKKRHRRSRGALQYQHDVASHERCLIRRGLKPINDKQHKQLMKRGYRVYVSSDVSVDDRERLISRNIPLKLGNEWLAIRSTQVKTHRRGPDDGPYIPAMRLLSGD